MQSIKLHVLIDLSSEFLIRRICRHSIAELNAEIARIVAREDELRRKIDAIVEDLEA